MVVPSFENLMALMAVDAMRAGAFQFLEKPLRLHELWAAIQEALRLAEQRWRDRKQSEAHSVKLASLTVAERATFEGLVSGKTNKVIADELRLSVRTVEERRGKLMKKLGVDTRAALVDLAASICYR
jgi:FixJ family two-component response regulator